VASDLHETGKMFFPYAQLATWILVGFKFSNTTVVSVFKNVV